MLSQPHSPCYGDADGGDNNFDDLREFETPSEAPSRQESREALSPHDDEAVQSNVLSASSRDLATAEATRKLLLAGGKMLELPQQSDLSDGSDSTLTRAVVRRSAADARKAGGARSNLSLHPSKRNRDR